MYHCKACLVGVYLRGGRDYLQRKHCSNVYNDFCTCNFLFRHLPFYRYIKADTHTHTYTHMNLHVSFNTILHLYVLTNICNNCYILICIWIMFLFFPIFILFNVFFVVVMMESNFFYYPSWLAQLPQLYLVVAFCDNATLFNHIRFSSNTKNSFILWN